MLTSLFAFSPIMPWQTLFQKFSSMLLTNPNISLQQLNIRLSASSLSNKSFAHLPFPISEVVEQSLSDEIHKAISVTELTLTSAAAPDLLLKYKQNIN